MEDIGLGAGLGALGFWLFIAAIVVAGIWESNRKRESQHETLRRIIESGQPIDEELTDKLLGLAENDKDVAGDLKVAGLITLFIAPGLALMGLIMSWTLAEELLGALLGVAALVGFLSMGLLYTSKVVAQRNSERQTTKS